MRLPSWRELYEKEREWEKRIEQEINEKVGRAAKDHPLFDKIFSSSLFLLPPPFNAIAQNIYDKAKGSGSDPLNEVHKYFEKIEEEGQEHYEIVANKLDSALIGIQDLEDVGSDILKIQEALIEKINNVDIKIDEIRNVLRDNHFAIMQPRWEKEKTAFVIGEGLVSFVNHASSWLTMDMFFDLCANVGFVNLNREEIRTIFDPTVDRESKPKLVDNFRKKADLNIDYDLSCALNIGANYALIRDALTEARAKNIHSDIIQRIILTPYRSILKRSKGLNKGSGVYKTAECMLQALEPYEESCNKIENPTQLWEMIYECVQPIAS